MRELNILKKTINRSILFLGVGGLQKYSINSAKKQGYTILGVDKDLNANSSKKCDYFLNCDSTDIVSIYSWACSIKDTKVVCVWANNDILIPTRTSLELAFDVKFPHASHAACLDMLSKERLSEILQNSGLMPKQYCSGEKHRFKYPVIIKPKKGSGSLGVKLIKSEYEFDEAGFNADNQVLEEYLKGDEYGTNHFSDGVTVYRLPAVKRYFDHNITMVPLGTVVADMNDIFLQKGCSKLEDLILKMNWSGPIKSDIIILEGKMRIIEMSARFHGEIDTSMVFKYLNIDLPSAYFSELTLNNNWKIDNNKDFVVGYISIFNDLKLYDDGFIHEILAKYGLKFLSSLKLRGESKTLDLVYPQSTGDLVAFVFYESKYELNKQEFSNLYKELNLLV